jgi:hypothetical protein
MWINQQLLACYYGLPVPVAGDSAIGTNRVVLTGPAQCRRYQPAQTVDAALVYTCCHLSGPPSGQFLLPLEPGLADYHTDYFTITEYNITRCIVLQLMQYKNQAAICLRAFKQISSFSICWCILILYLHMLVKQDNHY